MLLMFAGGMCTSCKHSTTPPDDTTHKCDTCEDTVKCDTCNIDKDSAAHAFMWKEFTIPSEGILTGVWTFGPNDMIIVGGNLWHFDGTTFQDMLPVRDGSNITLDGVFCGFSIFALTKKEFWLTYAGSAF